jgi:pSer/pThr/pTyr-binding forkhead associated (FHA) protein
VTVSRNHAVVLRTGDRTRLRDLGSLNGTVNRRRIEADEALEDGDERRSASSV